MILVINFGEVLQPLTNQIKLKRIYDDGSEDDGFRILVDRIWPRGISKQKANLSEWMKEIAPSDELRKWFDHDPKKFSEFKKRYKHELASSQEQQTMLIQLKQRLVAVNLTLIYAARDKQHNHAIVLKEIIAEQE